MKRKLLFYPFFIVFFLLLQTTLLQHARIRGVVPNLLITLTIVTALVRSSTEGAVVPFSGLCVDLRSELQDSMRCWGCTRHRGRVCKQEDIRENFLVVAFFAFIYSVVYESVVFVINNIMSGETDFAFAFTR